jgi:hypothetical protein
MENIKSVKCINNCCGDFWGITVGKEYNVLEKREVIQYSTPEKTVTEPRYRIVDDTNTEYLYPTYCFVEC